MTIDLDALERDVQAVADSGEISRRMRDNILATIRLARAQLNLRRLSQNKRSINDDCADLSAALLELNESCSAFLPTEPGRG